MASAETGAIENLEIETDLRYVAEEGVSQSKPEIEREREIPVAENVYSKKERVI